MVKNNAIINPDRKGEFMNHNEFEYKLQIEKMRENYNQNPPDKLKLHRPWWMFADDELSKIYNEKEILLNEGRIYYSYLLQANVKLFQSFPPFNYPAQIVYSVDPIIDENPLMLKNTVERVYSYKYSADTPPEEWAEMVANIKDERDRTSFFFDCVSESHTIKAKMQTLMVYRKHLPTRILQGHVLPIIACPDICDSVLILPQEYWSKEFTMQWLTDL